MRSRCLAVVTSFMAYYFVPGVKCGVESARIEDNYYNDRPTPGVRAERDPVRLCLDGANTHRVRASGSSAVVAVDGPARHQLAPRPAHRGHFCLAHLQLSA